MQTSVFATYGKFIYIFVIHCYSDEEEKEVIKPPQPKVKQIRKER